MTAVFADTFYYLAMLNPSDAQHQRAMAISAGVRRSVITTAWVLTEVADAMCRPPNRALFATFLHLLRADPGTTILPAVQPLFEDGVAHYAARPDQEWSLTDCISFVVMERRGLTDVLTADHHFEQAGFRALMK